MADRKYCVIGTPVAHSKSPELFRDIFVMAREKGSVAGSDECSYIINEIKTAEELAEFFADMRKGAFDGCNVTMPWKTLATAAMDSLTPQAALMGSVNTVVQREGKLTGHSTDGPGMIRAVEKAAGKLRGTRTVILGCGGAGRAIIAEAAESGFASRIDIVCRSGSKNYEIADALIKKLSGGCIINRIENDDTEAVKEAVLQADVCINATPVGMGESRDLLPIPEGIELPKGLIVADAIYEPLKTKLIVMAEEKGLVTVPGMMMLKEQAYIGAEFFGLL